MWSKGLLPSASLQTTMIDSKEDRNLSKNSGSRTRAGPQRNASCWFAQSAFFYIPRSPSRGGAAHSGLGPSTSVIYQEKNASQACVLGNLMGIFSTEVPSSQMILVYTKQNKVNKQKIQPTQNSSSNSSESIKDR